MVKVLTPRTAAAAKPNSSACSASAARMAGKAAHPGDVVDVAGANSAGAVRR